MEQVQLYAGATEDLRRSGHHIDVYADSGVSSPELCVKYDVDIREFVILAYLHDSGPTGLVAVSKNVGLSLTTTDACLRKLFANGLVRSSARSPKSYLPTTDGLVLLRKAGR